MADARIRLNVQSRVYGMRVAAMVGRALLWAGVPERRAHAAAERFLLVRVRVGTRAYWMRAGG